MGTLCAIWSVETDLAAAGESVSADLLSDLRGEHDRQGRRYTFSEWQRSQYIAGGASNHNDEAAFLVETEIHWTRCSTMVRSQFLQLRSVVSLPSSE